MEWFRMYHEARTDRKLDSLTDAEFRVWFNLLCMASDRKRNRGAVPCMDESLLAMEVARGDEQLLAEALSKLHKLKILETANDTLVFVAWEQRQYDNPSDTPAGVLARKRKQRSHDLSRDVTTSHDIEQNRAEQNITDQNREAMQLAMELGTTNPIHVDVVSEYLKSGMEAGAVRHAIYLTKKKDAGFGYWEAIVKRWRKQGIMTKTQAEADERKEQPQQQTSSPRYRPAAEVLKEQGIDL